MLSFTKIFKRVSGAQQDNQKRVPANVSRSFLDQIHGFLTDMLNNGGMDVGLIYYDNFIEKFVYKYVAGSYMLKIVFDDTSMSIELFNTETFENKRPEQFTLQDWNIVYSILMSSYRYLASKIENDFTNSYSF